MKTAFRYACSFEAQLSKWIKNVGQIALDSAVAKLKIELKGYENWDPYSHQFKGRYLTCRFTLLLVMDMS